MGGWGKGDSGKRGGVREGGGKWAYRLGLS